MKKKRNPSKHVFILANKTTSSTLFYLFFVFNEKNRAHIDIYYNFYSTFATSKQAKNKGIMKPIYSNLTCIIRKTKRCGFPKRKVSKIRKFQKRNVFYLFKHTRGRETQKQPVSLPLVLYIQFKPNIIFTGNQTDSLINVILVNMNITEV